MSKITIFSPDTGRIIGRGEGTVWPTDNPKTGARPWGGQDGDPVQQLLDAQKKLFDIKSSANGLSTSHMYVDAVKFIPSRKMGRLLRRLHGKQRLPRKMKKAARKIRLDVVDDGTRFTVTGRRTRWTERIIAKAKYRLSHDYLKRREEMMRDFLALRKPGMLTYEPSAQEDDPHGIIFRQQRGGYFVNPSSEMVLSREAMIRLHQQILPDISDSPEPNNFKT